nr:hypothetical protein BaRGS_011819 [Batillaria attramentaria]
MLTKKHSDALLMLTKIGEVEVHVSPHRSLNSSKGVVRDEALAYLSDEELKKQPKMVSSACQTDPMVETFTFKGRQKPPQQQKTTSTPAVVVVDSLAAQVKHGQA